MRKLVLYLWPLLWLAASQSHAGTAYWSDGFEGNVTNRWMVQYFVGGLYTGSNGIWHVGNPSAGPAVNASGYRTHSGTNCIFTQNYGYNQNARLICTNYTYQNITNSSTLYVSGDHPRLRFWHWFNFENVLGYVEVSPDQGTTWLQVSPTYETNSSDLVQLNGINGGGVWTRPSIDLSPFLGENIQIAFHFITPPNTGNGLGWFLDDLEVDISTPVLNWPEGFEANPTNNDWSADLGTWAIGTPTTGPPVNTNGFRTHSGTNCAGTVLTGNYLDYADTRLVSPPFTVPTTGNETLYFWQWYNFNEAQGFVEVNNGTNSSSSATNSIVTTNAVIVLNTNIYQLFGATNLGYATPLYWNPTIGGWTNATKTLGSVYESYDQNYSGEYLFEAGAAPLATVGSQNGSPIGENVDYRITNSLPFPQSSTPTNFLAMQAATWHLIAGTNHPVGYFAATTNYTYSTNTSVTGYQTSWTSISPTNTDVSSGTWTNTGLDLSAYAGQTIQIAFHFQSFQASAPGWYIDDLTFVAAPAISVPGPQTIYAGQTLTITNISVTNNFLPNATYTYSVPLYSTNYLINPTNGVLTWTNTGIVNGILNWTNSSVAPGTNTLYVKVTDNSAPPLTATNSIQLVILPPPAPTLTVPGTQTIELGQTLAMTNFVANTNLPTASFTFSLPSPSTNYWLNANGVLTWTNTTAPPGTTVVTINVADNSIPPLTASSQFDIVVAPPPMVVAPPPQAFHAGQTLAITIGATNTFLPASVFTYSLPAPSTNYWIDTNTGVLTWTNTGVINHVLYWTNSSVAPGTYTNFVTVTDNSTPPMSATSNFTVVILPPLPPTLTVPGNQSIYAGQTLFATNSATNSVLPNSIYHYYASGPANLIVTNLLTNGVVQWATAANQPSGSTNIIITVTDNSVPALLATNHFTVFVSPPPAPAFVLPPYPAIIYADQTTVWTFYATNSAFPNDTYTYLLIPNSSNPNPGNLDSSSLSKGILKWTPTSAQAGTQATITIGAEDNRLLTLSTTTNFSMYVLSMPPPTLTPGNATSAQAFSRASGFQFTFNTEPNSLWRIDASTNLLTWRPVFTNLSDDFGDLQVTDPLATNFLQRYYRAVAP